MLIDWFTVAAQVINFLVLVWLLKRFLYKPVLNAIDEREKRIATQLQDAEKKKAEALKAQIDFQRKTEEFEQQRSALLEGATKAAKIEGEKLLVASRKDAEDLRTKLQKAAYDDLDNLNIKIGTLAQAEVFSIARKALADLAGRSLEESIIDIFILRLHDMKDQEREELKATAKGSSNSALVRSAFELSPAKKAYIEEAVRPLLDEGVFIGFEAKPELIGGIELVANGQKIAWSIEDYLKTLTATLVALLVPKSDPVLPIPKPILRAA